MLRATIPALALGLIVAAAPVSAPPAMAQAMFEGCIEHEFVKPIRSRFRYADWQRTVHTSGWREGGRGHRHCARLQDLTGMTIEVETRDQWGSWQRLCEVNVMALSGRPIIRVWGNEYIPVCRELSGG